MILWVAHRRQHPTLQGVREHDAWAFLDVGLRECLSQSRKVMSAEVMEKLLKLVVAPAAQESAHVFRIAA